MTSLFGLITTTEAERRERQILLAGNRVATINKYTPLPNREAGNEKRLFVRGAAITLAVSLAVLAGVSVRTRGTAVSTSVPVINDGRPQHQSLSAETHITGASPSSHLVGETSTQETWECGAASGAVLGGADVVAYFSLSEDDAAVFGTQEHASVYNGYLFWFSSEDNKVKFEENPLGYIPAWGGFCSWGISREDWWTKDNLGPPADPAVWLITDDGVLYIFRSPSPRSWFEGNISGNIDVGNEIWASWWGEEAVPGAEETGSPMDTECLCSKATCLDQ